MPVVVAILHGVECCCERLVIICATPLWQTYTGRVRILLIRLFEGYAVFLVTSSALGVQWLGMGNKELHEMFQDYNPLKPRHAYGPQGHRGMSLLIFPDSPTGYYNGKRLEKHFLDARRSREDWNRPSKLMYHLGGNRILYGYMAVKEDMDIFNRHSKGTISCSLSHQTLLSRHMVEFFVLPLSHYEHKLFLKGMLY